MQNGTAASWSRSRPKIDLPRPPFFLFPQKGVLAKRDLKKSRCSKNFKHYVCSLSFAAKQQKVKPFFGGNITPEQNRETQPFSLFFSFLFFFLRPTFLLPQRFIAKLSITTG